MANAPVVLIKAYRDLSAIEATNYDQVKTAILAQYGLSLPALAQQVRDWTYDPALPVRVQAIALSGGLSGDRPLYKGATNVSSTSSEAKVGREANGMAVYPPPGRETLGGVWAQRKVALVPMVIFLWERGTSGQ